MSAEPSPSNQGALAPALRRNWEAERGGNTFRYIEVSKDDIRRANELAARVLGASLDELSAPARNLLRQIHVMVKGHCEAHNIAPAQYVFTRRDIREATGWTEWQVRTHARELEDLEYLKARAPGPGAGSTSMS